MLFFPPLRPSRLYSNASLFTLAVLPAGVSLLSPLPSFIGDLLPVASRIPRTFSLEPIVYNDRLLIVQGQRQYINGPRIKWQQRGVVEHNPS